MFDAALEGISTFLLYGNAVVFAAFLVYFGLRERWNRNWFGGVVLLLTVGILQMTVRAVVTAHWGEDYPGRDLVLMLGRLELFVSGVALIVGLLLSRRQHS